MNFYRIILIALSTLSIGILHAENAQNPFNGQTVNFGPQANQNGQFAPNSIVDPLFNGMRQDENSIQWDQQNAVSGREYQANDAVKQGNSGNVAAIVTGSALVATGTPMLFSPSLPVVLAGAQMIAMGGMEFAQAGATSGATGNNGAQYGTLMNGSPNLTAKKVDLGSLAQQIGTPEMRKTLSDHGIDADNFIDNLTSGNLQSPADVMKAIGNDSDISNEDMAQANLIANSKFGELGVPRLQNNEASDLVASTTGSGSLGAVGMGGAGGGKGPASDGMTTDANGNLILITRSGAGRGLASLGNGGLNGEIKTGIDPNAVVANIFGNKDGQSVMGPGALDAATRNALLAAGVQRPVKGQNIFSLAKRTFRTFHKYRAGSKKTKGVKHARS